MILAAGLGGCGGEAAPIVVERIKWTSESGDPDGLPGFRLWSDDLAQGARPEGERGIRSLAGLGFKALVCVDGDVPDVASATRYGLRVAHIPLGFDGFEPAAALQVAKVVRAADGPVFVHGADGGARTTAAAVIAQVASGASTLAVAMIKARTFSNLHAGGTLSASLQQVRMPSDDELAGVAYPPGAVAASGLRAQMLAIQKRVRLLESARAEGWSAPAGRPGLDVFHESLHLVTLLGGVTAEAGALADDKRFAYHSNDAEMSAKLMTLGIKREDPAAADRAWRRLQHSCTQCHRAFRQ